MCRYKGELSSILEPCFNLSAKCESKKPLLDQLLALLEPLHTNHDPLYCTWSVAMSQIHSLGVLKLMPVFSIAPLSNHPVTCEVKISLFRIRQIIIKLQAIRDQTYDLDLGYR